MTRATGSQSPKYHSRPQDEDMGDSKAVTMTRPVLLGTYKSDFLWLTCIHCIRLVQHFHNKMLESQSKFVPRKITSIAKDLERFFQSKAKILPMKSDDDIEVALPSRLVDTMKGGFPSTLCLPRPRSWRNVILRPFASLCVVLDLSWEEPWEPPPEIALQLTK